MTATHGFVDEPDVPALLGSLPHEIAIGEDVSYFLGRESLVATSERGMASWREKLFVWMSRNAQHANAFFDLPADRVVELGVQVELGRSSTCEVTSVDVG